jgi:GDP-mannose 6-dehydrogenase
VEWFARELRIRGLPPFYYPVSGRPGKSFLREISDAIEGSRRTIAFLTPAALTHEWVLLEIEAALQLDRTGDAQRLLLVLLEEVPDTDIPLLVRSRIRLNLFDPARAPGEFMRLLDLVGVPEKDRFDFIPEVGLPAREDLVTTVEADWRLNLGSPRDADPIVIFGLGYIGLSLAAALGDEGYTVLGVEQKPGKLRTMKAGASHFREPHLDATLHRVFSAGRFSASERVDAALQRAHSFVVCLGPSLESGAWNRHKFERILQEVGHAISRMPLDQCVCVVIAGTIQPDDLPVATKVLTKFSGGRSGERFDLITSPLFAREGQILQDLKRPALIVVGSDDGGENEAAKRWASTLLSLVEPELRTKTPLVQLRLQETAVLKLASNAFHAMKVAFANEVGRICDALDIDGRAVMRAFVQDETLNVSKRYLRPGFGFGGWCLEKDVGALVLASKAAGRSPLLEAVVPSNRLHILQGAELVVTHARLRPESTLGLVGLTFKAGSDDVRGSPALTLVREIKAAAVREGLSPFAFHVYDPDFTNAPDLTGKNLEEWQETLATTNFSFANVLPDLLKCSIWIYAKRMRLDFSSIPLTSQHLIVDLVSEIEPSRCKLPCSVVRLG